MKTSKLYFCDHCSKQVNVTLHDVTEPSSEPLGETTWEAKIEKRCSVCASEVADTEIVTNRTSAYIQAHARIEQEAGTPSDTAVEDLFKSQDALSALRFSPLTTVAEIEQACRTFSTSTHEVVARVFSVNGKPVVHLVREPHPGGLDAVLRPGSDLPLSYLARRQAS